jgi:LexA-binding, inner membrane-associated putative hydrolase
MSPVEHFLIGWVVANSATLNRSERAAVTIAGVIPDVDGLGLVAEVATRNSARPLLWWSEYHHVLGHNIGFCLLVTAVGFALATRRWLTAALVCVSFHLHLLCDLIGARGPDGDQWPIPYLSPFSSAWQWTWSGQWALNAWPNLLVAAMALAMTLYLAWKRGFSPVGTFLVASGQSVRGDLAPSISRFVGEGQRLATR